MGRSCFLLFPEIGFLGLTIWFRVSLCSRMPCRLNITSSLNSFPHSEYPFTVWLPLGLRIPDTRHYFVLDFCLPEKGGGRRWYILIQIRNCIWREREGALPCHSSFCKTNVQHIGRRTWQSYFFLYFIKCTHRKKFKHKLQGYIWMRHTYTSIQYLCHFWSYSAMRHF
jgi:hypothetical protein